MDVIDYVLTFTALLMLGIVAAMLIAKWRSAKLWNSVVYSDEPPRLWPHGYDDDECELPFSALTVDEEVVVPVVMGKDGDDDGRAQPSPDWSQRATVITGTGNRLRIVRRRTDLVPVPSSESISELDGRCPRGGAIPSDNIMPPEGA